MLLANARDEHRNRDVRLYLMPGEFDTVGVTDGTDAWVAPVIADPFSVNIIQIMKDVRDGKIIKPNEVPRKRHRIIAQLSDNYNNTKPGYMAHPGAQADRRRSRSTMVDSASDCGTVLLPLRNEGQDSLRPVELP